MRLPMGAGSMRVLSPHCARGPGRSQWWWALELLVAGMGAVCVVQGPSELSQEVNMVAAEIRGSEAGTGREDCGMVGWGGGNA